MSSENTKPIKIAYLIFGPESAGNRMMARSFDTAGVSNPYSKNGEYISGPHPEPSYTENPLLISMSIPYNNQWPSIINIYHAARQKGYKIYLILLDRETDFMAKSQVVQGRVNKLGSAYKNIERAREHLDKAVTLLDVRPLYINYEDFVTDREVRRVLFEEVFGLSEPTLEYFNANEKGL